MEDNIKFIGIIIVIGLIFIIYTNIKQNKKKKKTKRVIRNNTFTETNRNDDIIQRSDSFLTKIVSTESDERQELIRKLRKGDILTLLREAANQQNPNAILLLNNERKCIGYLSKDVAKSLAPLIDKKIKYEGIVYELNYSGGILDLIVRLKKNKKEEHSNKKLVNRALSKSIRVREKYEGKEEMDKGVDILINKIIEVSSSECDLNKVFIIEEATEEDLNKVCLKLEYVYGCFKNLIRVWMEEVIIPSEEDLNAQLDLIINAYEDSTINIKLEEDITDINKYYKFLKLRNEIFNNLIKNICKSKDKINRDYRELYVLNTNQLIQSIEDKMTNNVKMIIRMQERKGL
ncbi:hypothetical protein CHF27_002825 [Romboutsia maritimum]|uniref:HIRAN domain-containing protein n=1 Tax=Romboutsia maritimum TaxID=2020948 RepID=A0A371IVT9_9FIRM|nr:HIRAN domain-containing protein [Romboutsia maritimum]RDY24591.1 hypothetical protein CHF27_002825 [Romboutsia maritimum]